MLDPLAVQAFVLVAELGSFTKAARALNSTQSTVSLRLKRLEEALGEQLVERTPRAVRLSAAGETFLGPAQALVAAHRDAATALAVKRRRLAVGVSHHLVGPELAGLLKGLASVDPSLVVDLRIEATRALLDLYDAGLLDAVIVLRHPESRREGETLGVEPMAWMGAPGLAWRAGAPVPLAVQPPPCAMRKVALDALDTAGVPWREAIVGAGAATTGAAAAAGLGVAALLRRAAPAGTVDLGSLRGLPPLPSREVVLHSRIADPGAGPGLRTLAAAFRAPRQGSSDGPGTA
ncbi:MAG TPA: LysR family transcriptional regulator [Salinarimonas sp.]|nr:LysR family transcriptional regulator [Salinarimonas sp.]